MAYKKILARSHSIHLHDRDRKQTFLTSDGKDRGLDNEVRVNGSEVKVNGSEAKVNQAQANGGEVKVTRNGFRKNGIKAIALSTEHRERLTRLKKYISNVNLNFRPLRPGHRLFRSVDKGSKEPKAENNNTGKGRSKVERRPSFTSKMFKKFTLRQRAYSESDLLR